MVSYLKRRLKTRYVGKTLHYFAVTTSTMDEARKLADAGVPEGTAVIAGKQQAGRGRLGRSWLSPEGGLATSIIFRPALADIRLLPALASVAVFRCLARSGVQASIKWPNDVLISGKKVCGILVENMFGAGNLEYSVIGIGINVNFDTTRFPEIAGIATSLSVELGKEISVQEVALQLYTELEDLYGSIAQPDVILAEWANSMDTLGRRVSVNSGGCAIEGIAESVNREGNLILRLDDGTKRQIVAGDVSNVRDKID